METKKRFGFIKGTPEALEAGRKMVETKKYLKAQKIIKLNKLYNDVFHIKEPKPVKEKKISPSIEQQKENKRLWDIAYNKKRPKHNSPEHIDNDKKVAFNRWDKEKNVQKKSWVSIKFKKKYGITIPEMIDGKELILNKSKKELA